MEEGQSMDTLTSCYKLLTSVLSGLLETKIATLTFAHRQEALAAVLLLLLLGVFIFFGSYFKKKKPGRTNIVLPALLSSVPKSKMAFARHVPNWLFLMGAIFFFLALADPNLPFAKEEISYPGIRIALIVDASGSMDEGEGDAYTLKSLKTKSGRTERFYTAVAAAEYFMKLRIKGEYRDLMSLIEFGNEAYVITPFTNDYENILLSVGLIAEPEEWDRFPTKGTVIIKALDQGVELFKAFDFLKPNSVGNLMLIFSDGEDSQAVLDNRPLSEILNGARKNKIPVYFVRTTSKFLSVDDKLWKDAVENTGGKFYAANSEELILSALWDIDKEAKGKIIQKRYNSRQPKFAPFALAALMLWSVAMFLKFFLKYFRKFP